MRAPLLSCFALFLALPAAAQDATGPVPNELFQALDWRCIGPFRGGRSAAVAGVRGDRDTYYFGACGGGVWKTRDGGRSWQNVSDGSFGGSIGAVAVSESDPNVVYVGGGEKTVRGNVSHGDGIWKSLDGGRSWEFIGLPESRHVSRIRIHPRNPDIVYAAVMGHLSGPNEERGVYRSTDGGKSWERILYANEQAGAVDLAFEPGNPRTLYASTWRVIRTPYSLESGGEGSGLWKSTDAGDTWQELSRNKGLPEGTLGIIGVAPSPARPERVWAMVEAEEGGLFRSEDAGETWTRVNSDRSLRQRAWYYTRCYADPQDPEVVYVLNVGFHKSVDGGRTFSTLRPPHGDNHDLWIDPDDPKRMIESNDGGANVSYDGGQTWSPQDNQPTAQFYRVTTDNHVPYRVYGAQQDNSTVRILSRSDRGAIGIRDWEPTAGGESGHIAPHPLDPEIVYGGSYGGYLQRLDHRTGASRNVNVWPDNPMGWGAAELKYRFQWNFPIFFSPHDPQVLYAAGNVLFKTTDEGQSWQAISPDLTRNDKSRQGPSGGPITKDNTSVEYYCTIFAAIESPYEKGLLWCGSDDGLLHVSRDAGANWEDVTPPQMPEWTMINSIEAHPFEKGGLYVAATRYKLDDFRPYLYITTDYGKSWREVTAGIDPTHFTRVIRADPHRRGLLYAGTERGVYVSYDDGAHWQKLQLNLPIVPITDLAVKEGDLIAATQGRAFWILDDLHHLRQLHPDAAQAALHLFEPEPTVQMRGGGRFRRGGGNAGQNPPAGVVVRYFVAGNEDEKIEDEITLEFLDREGQRIARRSTKAKERDEKLEVKPGMNRFEWDMRYPDAEDFEGMILWGGSTRGPLAVPGIYTVRLSRGEQVLTREFEIRKDPRIPATIEDLQARFDFLIECRDKLTETHRGIARIRDVRQQIDAVLERAKGAGDGEVAAAEAAAGGEAGAGKVLAEAGKKLERTLTEVEEALYQVKNRSRQDPLNFPIRLNNKLAAVAGVVASSDFRPTDQAVAVKDELIQRIDSWLEILDQALTTDLAAFNALAAKQGVPHVK